MSDEEPEPDTPASRFAGAKAFLSAAFSLLFVIPVGAVVAAVFVPLVSAFGLDILLWLSIEIALATALTLIAYGGRRRLEEEMDEPPESANRVSAALMDSFWVFDCLYLDALFGWCSHETFQVVGKEHEFQIFSALATATAAMTLAAAWRYGSYVHALLSRESVDLR